MEEQYYKCCECGRRITLTEYGANYSRCGTCAQAYEEEKNEIERRRENELEKIRERREREDEEFLRNVRD